MQPEPAAPRTGRALILVVEQDPQMRRLERYFLEQAGYAVELAVDGNQALETAQRLRPDIVVAEILVAGLDGLSVCRALKSDPETRSIVVVIFSILAAEQRARDAGADGFLRKPLDDARLVQSIEALLAHQRQGNGPEGGATDATA
ncbi:MAG TPA: response regulator [Thermoanaerobaculia bacterium]|jgi:CheY-like chemotaxis protein|nr:response regulator [Thermoanaerobaculia bacterium]